MIERERRVCVLCVELIASGFRFEASAVSQLQTRSDHTHSKQLLPAEANKRRTARWASLTE